MYKKLFELIEKNKSFIITTHVNPDGDALGSEVALFTFLKNLKKNVDIINYSATPKNYHFLNNSGIIQKFEEDKHKDVIKNSDVVFILDTNEYARLKSMSDYIKASPAKKVCIDHHISYSNNGFDYTLFNTDSPATGEILFNFFESIGNKIINKEMAIALYTAIMTDTGSFRFPRTDSNTHKITAKLIESGANPEIISDEIYNKSSFGKLKLLAIFLNKLTLISDGKIIYAVLLQTDFAKNGTDVIDSDGFSHHMMSINTVQIGIIYTQAKTGIKISFRSKGNINVNDLAKEVNGGGHKNAAGAWIEHDDIDEIVKKVNSIANKYII